MAANDITQIRRRHADLVDRYRSALPVPASGSASLVAKIVSIPGGTGPRFFTVTLAPPSGPSNPVAGSSGSFATTPDQFLALSLTGGPTGTTNPILLTQVDGVWIFEA